MSQCFPKELNHLAQTALRMRTNRDQAMPSPPQSHRSLMGSTALRSLAVAYWTHELQQQHPGFLMSHFFPEKVL